MQSVSSNNPIIRISPFVPITVPMTTAELEENESGDLAQNLTTNLPNVVTQKNLPPSLLVAGPVQVDYPLPVLETLNPPTDKSASRLQFFAQNWKKITQDSWTLQTIQGYKIPFCRRPRQRRVRITRTNSHTEAKQMNLAIANLLAKGAVKAIIISLPQSKLNSIVDACQLLLVQRSGLRTLSTLIGCMSHASQKRIMLALLHYRSLPRLHLQAVAHYGHRGNVLIPLTYRALADPEWWISESNHLNGCPIRHPPIDATL